MSFGAPWAIPRISSPRKCIRSTDRGGDEVTLRPEATAGVARALISGGLAQQLPLKFFTHGPMFRYERPQKGRLRQFHQIDIEVLGVPEAIADVEIIAVGAHILDELGVRDKTTLELNTLGDADSRRAYRDVLVAYFQDHRSGLSEDSRNRLERNPLRILDSKDEGDRAILVDAPLFPDYLTPSATDYFAEVRDGLDALDIAYALNPKLVRGLDYYCHTAFEFTTEALGRPGRGDRGRSLRRLGRNHGRTADGRHRLGRRHREARSVD